MTTRYLEEILEKNTGIIMGLGSQELEVIKDTSNEEEFSFPKIHPLDWAVTLLHMNSLFCMDDHSSPLLFLMLFLSLHAPP